MSSDDEIAILILILLVASRSARVDWNAGAAPADWTWPIPTIVSAGVERAPVVSQEYRAPAHMGVDLMYKAVRQPPVYDAPDTVPVLAARSGTLWLVQRTPRGWSVVLDHGKPWSTYYQHLATVDATIASGVQGVTRAGAAMAVAAGQQIGIMGIDPTDPERVRHLHFATWYQGVGDAASVDPMAAMKSWRMKRKAI